MAELAEWVRKHIGPMSNEQIRATLDEDPEWLSKSMRSALRAYLLAADTESAREAAKRAAVNVDIARRSAFWSMVAACAGAISAFLALVALLLGSGQ